MRRLALIALAPLALALPVRAQPADPHAGHHEPPAEDAHAGHGAAAEPEPADPHAGHHMPPPDADPHAGHDMPTTPDDPHAGHHMPAAPAGGEPPPAAPADHAADSFYPPAEMASARAQLVREHGDVRWSKAMLETAEIAPSSEAYEWEARASFGGDINRGLLKSQGSGDADEGVERAEVQALYSRAIAPYFNLLAGVRQDLEPRPRRTYATVGLEGVAPYWFEVDGALFLSNEGELSARLEGAYDLRITQLLILEPRAELDLMAADAPELGLGSGLSTAEVGLRLRYAVTPEFAPYVGLTHERSFGRTADLARADGRHVEDTRFVVGLRAWF